MKRIEQAIGISNHESKCNHDLDGYGIIMEIYGGSYWIKVKVCCKLGDSQRPNYIRPHVSSLHIIIKQINQKIDHTWLTVGCIGAWLLMWRLLCAWSRFIQFGLDHMWPKSCHVGIMSWVRSRGMLGVRTVSEDEMCCGPSNLGDLQEGSGCSWSKRQNILLRPSSHQVPHPWLRHNN